MAHLCKCCDIPSDLGQGTCSRCPLKIYFKLGNSTGHCTPHYEEWVGEYYMVSKARFTDMDKSKRLAKIVQNELRECLKAGI